MNPQWYNDKRFQQIDGDKRAFIQACLGNCQCLSKEDLLNAYLRMDQEMKKKGISFSPKEQNLIKDILIDNMPDQDQKRIRQMLCMLSLSK